VRLTLRYTTPDVRCRDRPDECDGGISKTTGIGGPVVLRQDDVYAGARLTDLTTLG